MAKTAHTTTAPAPAQPGSSRPSVIPPDAPARITNVDPALLPDRYAMMVEGNCLEPDINDGDLVMFDKRLPVRAGDFAAIYLKPECVAPGHHQARVKRLVLDIPSWVQFPYTESPNSELAALIVAEMFNPPMQFKVRCTDVLAVHHCLGRVPAHIQTTYQPYADLERKAAVSAGWSRRDLLAGAISIVPVAGLASLPVLAADEPDPTFAAIEAHKAAGAAFEAAVAVECRLEDDLPDDARQSSITSWEHVIVETDDPRWIAAIEAWHQTCHAVDELAWAFVEHPPTTAAGVAALMAYIGEASEGWFPDGFQSAINRVLAGVLVRTAGGAS